MYSKYAMYIPFLIILIYCEVLFIILFAIISMGFSCWNLANFSSLVLLKTHTKFVNYVYALKKIGS